MSYSVSKKFANMKPSATREILKATSDANIIAFAGGSPAVEAFPCNEVKKLSAEILEENPVSALVYGISEGYEPLRKTVADWLKKRNNIGKDDDTVIITSGGTQVMDLTTRVMTSEGDTIICEEPSFVGSLNCFRSHGCKLKGVPIESDGMDVVALEKTVKETPNAKFIYTIPNFQNPGGTTLSWEKRKEIYRIAKENDLLILEDDPYGNLRVDGEDVPAIKTLDEDGIGKQVSDVHTAVLNQMIVDRWFKEYDVDEHIDEIRKIYRRKLNLMCDCLDKYCPSLEYVRPQGGLFIWVKLPDNVPMTDYCKRLVENKVAVVPGTAFMTDENAQCPYIRLNFSTPSDENIIKGVEIMGKVLKQY